MAMKPSDIANSLGHTNSLWITADDFLELVKANETEAVTKCIKAGFDPKQDHLTTNRSYLWHAINAGHLDMVKCLCDSKNGGDFYLAPTADPKPFFDAILFGHSEIVKFLVQRYKHLVQAQTATLVTPLHMVFQSRVSPFERRKLCAFFLLNGATLNQQDWMKRLPVDVMALNPDTKNDAEIEKIEDQLLFTNAMKLLAFSKSNSTEKFKNLTLEQMQAAFPFSLNGRDFETGYTALHYAVINGNAALVHQLVLAEASCYLQGKDNKTAMDLGYDHVNPSIRLLFRAKRFNSLLEDEKNRKKLVGISPGAVFDLIIPEISDIKNESEKDEILRRLKQSVETHPNAYRYFDYRDKLGMDGKTISEAILRALLYSKNAEDLKVFKDGGFNEKAKGLILAVASGNLQSVQNCLKAGADPNQTLDPDNTVLVLALKKHDSAIAKLLVESGASPLPIKKFGASPFFVAIDELQADMVQLFLERDPKLINFAHATGHTPLDYLARTQPQTPEQSAEKLRICETLLTSGAILNAKSLVTGKTAEELFLYFFNNTITTPWGEWDPNTQAGHESITRVGTMLKCANRLLNIAKASTSLKNGNDGREVDSCLFELGPAVNARDAETGRTALHCAIINRNTDLILRLLRFGPKVGIEDNTRKSAYKLAEECDDVFIKVVVLMINLASVLENENVVRSKLCHAQLFRWNRDSSATLHNLHAPIMNDLVEERQYKFADECSVLSLEVFDQIIMYLKLLLGRDVQHHEHYTYITDSLFRDCIRLKYVKHYEKFITGIREHYQYALSINPHLRDCRYDDDFLSLRLDTVDEGGYGLSLGSLLFEKTSSEARMVACRALLKNAKKMQPGFSLNTQIPLIGKEKGVMIGKEKVTVNNPSLGYPLCEAVSLGDTQLVGLLIEYGAAVSFPVNYPFYPLTRAVEAGNLEMTKLLLQHDAVISNQHILAAQKNYTEIVEVLLEAGANVNSPDGVPSNDAYAMQDTCLVFAIKHANFKLIKLLIEQYGASLYITDALNVYHCCAVHWGFTGDAKQDKDHPYLSEEQVNILRYFAKLGVDPNFCANEPERRTPVIEAILSRNIHVFDELLKLDNTNIFNSSSSAPTILTYLQGIMKFSPDYIDFMSQKLLEREWIQIFKKSLPKVFQQENNPEREKLVSFVTCLANNFSKMMVKKKVIFSFNAKTQSHNVSISFNLFKSCSDFKEISQFIAERRGKNYKIHLSDFTRTLHAVFKRVKEEHEISERVIMEALLQETDERQAFDRRARLKKSIDFQRQAEPITRDLLTMPNRIFELRYLDLFRRILSEQENLQALIVQNDEINRKAPTNSKKINSWKQRKNDNTEKLEWLTKQVQEAQDLVKALEKKFKDFNLIYNRIRNRAFQLIENGKIKAAKKQVEILEDFLSKDSKELNEAGIIILNGKLNEILEEIKRSSESYEKHNEADGKLPRVAEEDFVEQKNREETQRLAKDLTNKQKDFINEREAFLSQAARHIEALEKSFSKAKPKPEAQVPAKANEGVKGSGLGLVATQPNTETKGKIEQDTVAGAEGYEVRKPGRSVKRGPTKRTFGNLTELPKKMQVRNKVTELGRVLKNPNGCDKDDPRKAEAQKLEIYALLLSCAQTMHTIKDIKGEAVFPQPMAEKFRNTIYHCYTLFDAFSGKEDLIIKYVKKGKSGSPETHRYHASVSEIFNQIRDMALNLNAYIQDKLQNKGKPKVEAETKKIHEYCANIDPNLAVAPPAPASEVKDGHEVRSIQHAAHLSVQEQAAKLMPKEAAEKLKIHCQQIMEAVGSPLFEAIVRVTIPPKQESCIEIMKTAHQEWQALNTLEKDWKFKRKLPLCIRKQARALLEARMGSFYAYAADHFSSLLEYMPNKKGFRRFREEGNKIRHNVKHSKAKVQEQPSLPKTEDQDYPALPSGQSSQAVVIQRLDANAHGNANAGTDVELPNARGQIKLFSLGLHNSAYQAESRRQPVASSSRDSAVDRDSAGPARETKKSSPTLSGKKQLD